MFRVCISLADAASIKCCSADYLLALGEASLLNFLVRVPPFRSYGYGRDQTKIPGANYLRPGWSYLTIRRADVAEIRATGVCELSVVPRADLPMHKHEHAGVSSYHFPERIQVKISDLFLDERVTYSGANFFPSAIANAIERRESSGATVTSDYSQNELRSSHETKLLLKLQAASAKWWNLFDPSDPSTAPTNKQVADWLTREGVTPNIAAAMATILRADGLKTGRR